MNIYRHSDKASGAINARMTAEFQNMSSSLRFDELNVVTVKKRVTAMYQRIQKVARREYRKVVRAVKKDTEKEMNIGPVKLAAAALVAATLSGYDPVMRYVFNHEWNRKRDRLVESLMASGNRREMREALTRAMTLLAGQAGQFADNLTDETRTEVFTIAGVEEVYWNTQQDGRVCKICEERDGHKYPLMDLPDKHPRCRCYITAAR